MTEKKYHTEEERKAARNASARAYRLKNRGKVYASTQRWRDLNLEELRRYSMWNNCRDRSRKKGLEFTITRDDITIPEYCPILHVKLESGFSKSRDNSPSVDRIDLAKGYTPDNIQIISYLANRMKNSASPEQLVLFAEWVLMFYE